MLIHGESQAATAKLEDVIYRWEMIFSVHLFLVFIQKCLKVKLFSYSPFLLLLRVNVNKRCLNMSLRIDR